MKCSFCDSEIEKGTGKLYIKKTGKMFYFCSSKCEKNQLKLKRKPLRLKWAKKVKGPAPKPAKKAPAKAKSAVEKPDAKPTKK